MKHLPQITLLAVDTTAKSHLAERAILKSLEQCSFGIVKLLTHNMALKYAIKIPKIEGLEAYSKFCIREMCKHVETPFALVCQSDGYVLNGGAWTDEFLEYDYCGSPWLPSNSVGNGGFSLRSKRLLQLLSKLPQGQDHPEDAAICIHHRKTLESLGMKIAPLQLARKFSIESRSWNSIEWEGVPTGWSNQFGFHSFLTPLPKDKKICNVFHHSGDIGDVLYSLPVIKALGGGALFLSIDNRYPHPLPSRWGRMGGDPEWVNNLTPLLESQDCIERVSFTHGLPYSTDYDLNKFRLPWKNRTACDFDSIKKLHCDAFGVTWPDDKPWLEINDPIVVPGRSIVVNRTQRYHNDEFPWWKLVPKYHDKMVFVGTDQEAELFQGIGYPLKVPHYPTKNLHEAARIIAGAKVFIGNQSSPLAIAHGLCKNVIVEEWPQNANCHLVRNNAIYWKAGDIEIPKEWL